MARICQITGKGARSGQKKSHSQVKIKRQVHPNLQTKRLINPATGQIIKLQLTTGALKTLVKWQAAGRVYDLRKLISQ